MNPVITALSVLPISAASLDDCSHGARAFSLAFDAARPVDSATPRDRSCSESECRTYTLFYLKIPWSLFIADSAERQSRSERCHLQCRTHRSPRPPRSRHFPSLGYRLYARGVPFKLQLKTRGNIENYLPGYLFLNRFHAHFELYKIIFVHVQVQRTS